ncbi:TonB-dependent receptor [Fulvivirgaceae bacterium BMA10]|uniref:TonB-dependent receptor n=1 Tax=Splendidivirga corallicola TaxID=3051826 RepID=A0ABT8KLS5_9BACT|nr:TonB-dependent receptor [Fulvivirgaceae bacterium BMA10]
MKLELLKTIMFASKGACYIFILQLLGLQLAIADGVDAQNLDETKVTIQMRQVTLDEVFGEIENQTNFSFVKIIDKKLSQAHVDVVFVDTSLRSVLEYLAENSGLEFKRINETISVRSTNKKRRAKEVIIEVDRTIQGKVTDSDSGEPLIGATVQVKGTDIGTITDVEGNFILSVPDDIETLVVSYIGFKSMEVAIGDRVNFNISLEADVSALEEVIVVGYGTQEKGDVTGAIEKVDFEDVEKSGFNSIDQILQGRTTGLQISNVSGNPGSGQQINIRGVSSIQGSTEPLIVIDGIPVNNADPSALNGPLGSVNTQSPLSLINTNDIETIEVLKDASAAAIYGSRATNGVLLITTKSGQKGKTRVSLNAYTGFQDQPIEIKTTDVDTWYQINNEARANANTQLGLSAGDPGFLEPLVNPAVQTTDWIGAITRESASISDINVSLSSGNDKTTIFGSVGYFNQEGWYLTQRFQRYTSKLKIDHSISSNAKVGLNFLGSHGINNKVSTHEGGTRLLERALEQRPGDPIFLDDGSYNIGGSATLTRHNGFQVLQENDSEYKTYRGILNAYAQIGFLKGFTYKISASTDLGFFNDYLYRSPNSIRARSVGGEVHESRNFSTNFLLDNQLTYTGTSGDLSYDVTFVHSYQKFTLDRNYVRGIGLPSSSFTRISAATQLLNTNFGVTALRGSGKSENALESYIGRVQLKFKDRYLFSASLRNDGSSRLSEDNRYGVFPSVSVGWRITEEPFIQSDLLSNLKLRVSYGLTGNLEAVSDFASLALTAGGANYDNENGIIVAQQGNSDLQWETASQFDIGFDADFLDGRFGLTLDYFQQVTDDLLFDRPIRATSGFSTITENVGSMKNSGLEISIGAEAVKTKDFSWSIDLNTSFVSNKITSLNEGVDQIIVGDHVLKVGEAIGSFFLIRQVGIYQSDSEVPEALFANGIRAGDVRFEDLNGDGNINADDRQVAGSALPDFYGGITNTFHYKNFDLSIFMPFSVGNELYWNRFELDALGGRDRNMRQESVDNRWTGPGTSNSVPRAIALSGPANHNFQSSDRWLEDASFISLRTITLGYNLPKSLLEKVGVSSLRAYVSANNLKTFTKYPGYTPEASDSRDARSFGRDFVTAPPLRTFIFGINANF